MPTKIVLVSGYGDGYLNLAEGLAAFHGTERFPILKKPFRNADLVALLTEMTAVVNEAGHARRCSGRAFGLS